MEKENPTKTDEQALTPHKPPPNTTGEQAVMAQTSSPNTTGEQAVMALTSSPNTTREQAVIAQTSSPNTTGEQAVMALTSSPNTTGEQAVMAQTSSPNTTGKQAVMAQTSSPNTTSEQAVMAQTLSTTISDEQAVMAQTLSTTISDEQAVVAQTSSPNTTGEQAVMAQTSSPNTTGEQAVMAQTLSTTISDEQVVMAQTSSPNTTGKQAVMAQTSSPNTTGEQAVMAQTSSPNTTGEQAVMVQQTLSTTISDEQAVGHSTNLQYAFKQSISRILISSVIVEVCTLEQAKIAESAGAGCVCVTPPPSAAISYMPDPSLVEEIKRQVTIAVMAKVRVGHFVEAQILETLAIDFIDESETLGITDESHFINKHNFKIPFASGCSDLGQALNRFQEGAVVLRCQGSNLAETVKSVRKVAGDLRRLSNMDEDELFTFAERIEAPYNIVERAKRMGILPVRLLASGGIETPADAALMMKLGCSGVFIGVEVFRYGGDTHQKLSSIVRAVKNYNDISQVAEASYGFGDGGGL